MATRAPPGAEQIDDVELVQEAEVADDLVALVVERHPAGERRRR